MHVGYTTMNTPEDVPPAELAVALEARGFESLWIGEHGHIPTSRLTPYPAGGEMPQQYRRMMDPFVSLSIAATATTRLRLATGVALPLEHDLFALAKTAATLDVLSGGRVLFGVGVGWNREELANCQPALPWAQRYQALADRTAALRALWRDGEAAHDGPFDAFEPVWSEPKPAQRPGPPILCGTAGKVGTSHAVAWADAWMPMDIALGDVARSIARFRRLATEAGRSEIAITLVAWGDPTLDTLGSYRDLGVERVVVGAAREGWSDPATTYPFLDRYAAMVDALG